MFHLLKITKLACLTVNNLSHVFRGRAWAKCQDEPSRLGGIHYWKMVSECSTYNFLLLAIFGATVLMCASLFRLHKGLIYLTSLQQSSLHWQHMPCSIWNSACKVEVFNKQKLHFIYFTIYAWQNGKLALFVHQGNIIFLFIYVNSRR